MPGGDETALVALWQFFAVSLTWLPSLLFGILLESTRSMGIALLAAPIMHLTGAAILCTINIEQGKLEIRSTLSMRQGAWKTDVSDLHGMPHKKNSRQIRVTESSFNIDTIMSNMAWKDDLRRSSSSFQRQRSSSADGNDSEPDSPSTPGGSTPGGSTPGSARSNRTSFTFGRKVRPSSGSDLGRGSLDSSQHSDPGGNEKIPEATDVVPARIRASSE